MLGMSQEDSSNCDLLPMWPLEQCAWDRCVPWINQWGPSAGRQLKLCLVSGFKVTPWGREPPCDSAMSLLGAQLILEQPEHELCRSTYTWIFFFSVVNTTVQHGPQLVESMVRDMWDLEEPHIGKANYKLYLDFFFHLASVWKFLGPGIKLPPRQ